MIMNTRTSKILAGAVAAALGASLCVPSGAWGSEEGAPVQSSEAEAASASAAATVGDASYDTVAAALAAAAQGGGTVLVSADAVLTESIDVSGSVTLSIASGATLDMAGCAIAVAEGGSLTVQGEGAVKDSTNPSAAAVSVASDGGLTVTGCDFTALSAPISAAGGAAVSISGGKFASALDSAWCASGYMPATATVDAAAYYTAVQASLNYWGGALRMDSYLTDTGTYSTYQKADIRFGFNIVLPDGATLQSFGWEYGTTSSLGKTLDGQNSREAGSLSTDPEDATGTVANIVFTGVPVKKYDSSIYAQMHVTYVEGGVTYAIDGDVVSNKVLDVAWAVYNDTTNAKSVRDYANSLIVAEDKSSWSGYY